MPSRVIHESARASESLNRLSDAAERMFWRLTTVADDYGRFNANITAMIATCFPLRARDITDKCGEALLAELVAQDLIRLYEVNGRRFGFFTNWTQYQQTRAKKSKFPDPPSDSNGSHLLADANTCFRAGSAPFTITNTNTNTRSDLSSGEEESEKEGMCAGEAQVDEHLPRKQEEAGSTPAASLEPALSASIVQEQAFDEFWTAYPRKTAKQDAQKAWRKLKPDTELKTRILTDLKRFETADPQFIPYPASYLNGKRWQDEPLPLSRVGPRIRPDGLDLGGGAMESLVRRAGLLPNDLRRDVNVADYGQRQLVQAADGRRDGNGVATPIERPLPRRL